MSFDDKGKEQMAGGVIPVEKRTAYRTWRDKSGRTNAGVLVANYPVTSRIEEKISSPHNGFVTANIDVIYTINNVDVLRRESQIIMRPDKSEATITNKESFFAGACAERIGFEYATITKEQFLVLAKLFGITVEGE